MVGNNASALSTEAAKKIAALIEEKSNGTLKPELYLEGQLGDNDEDLCTGLSEGNYEMLINAEMLFNWAVPEWMELFNIDVYKRQPQKDRVRMELNGLYYSLYCYWLVHGEPEKAKDAIRELLKVAYPGAFAHTKAIPIAKRLGLLE